MWVTASKTAVLSIISGEWVSSDWPVCPVSETAAPHRLGAALTYARRYALFTLVGIAGEDDLDAPDLGAIPQADPQRDASDGPGLNGLAQAAGPPTELRRRAVLSRPARVILPAEQSALERDRLLAELSGLKSTDEAADWAHRSLLAKNTLMAADAELVEAGFRGKLALFGDQPPWGPTEAAQGPIEAQNSPDEPRRHQALSRRSQGAQPCPRGRQDHPPARQGPPQIRFHPALRGVRPHPRRCPPSPVCTT